VVGRVTDGDRPALFHYPAGVRLADGTIAPAARIGVFLADDGMAPWLLTPAGRAIMTAAAGIAASVTFRPAGMPGTGMPRTGM
jgi:hypothetical protein